MSSSLVISFIFTHYLLLQASPVAGFRQATRFVINFTKAAISLTVSMLRYSPFCLSKRLVPQCQTARIARSEGMFRALWPPSWPAEPIGVMIFRRRHEHAFSGPWLKPMHRRPLPADRQNSLVV
jgi:hypothetical protein